MVAAALFTTQGFADDRPVGVDPEEAPFAALAPLSDRELDTLRGGAVLPGGLTVDVTALLRVMVDGAELARSTVTSGSPFVVPMGANPSLAMTAGKAPLIIQNALNGIHVEQYRELNFRISNLPISLGAGRFVPTPVSPGGILP